jgi:hypothetical protein
MELGTMADIADVVGGLVVVGGALFALVQFREFRRQRQDTVAVDIVQTFSDAEFARCLEAVRELPDGISLAEMRSHGVAVQSAALRVAMYYEAVGLLAFRRIVPFSIVRELTGGMCVVVSRKLQVWMNDVRREHHHEAFAEWFQWLAERLAESDDEKNANPAYTRYANWRPKG